MRIKLLKVNEVKNLQVMLPETLVILVLNWPYEDLVLRDQILSLEPHVDIFPSEDGQLVSQTHTIAPVELIVYKLKTNYI